MKLFITATGTNVGKTETTLELISLFAAKGFSVGVCKPIETGVKEEALDAKALLLATQKVNPSFHMFTAEDITAYTFSLPAAPFCADMDMTIDINVIIEKIDSLSKLCDILLIEGAGGLMVPITQKFMMIDLIKKLDVKTLLVTPSRLGCINDTLLSIEALKHRDIEFDWCVNIYEDRESFEYVTQPYYDKEFPHWWSRESGLEKFVETILLGVA